MFRTILPIQLLRRKGNVNAMEACHLLELLLNLSFSLNKSLSLSLEFLRGCFEFDVIIVTFLAEPGALLATHVGTVDGREIIGLLALGARSAGRADALLAGCGGRRLNGTSVGVFGTRCDARQDVLTVLLTEVTQNGFAELLAVKWECERQFSTSWDDADGTSLRGRNQLLDREVTYLMALSEKSYPRTFMAL
jgi:hypothetical protein